MDAGPNHELALVMTKERADMAEPIVVRCRPSRPRQTYTLCWGPDRRGASSRISVEPICADAFCRCRRYCGCRGCARDLATHDSCMASVECTLGSWPTRAGQRRQIY